MALSPNYNWSEPDNSSLVKDGAQAMRTLGDAIDTSVWNVGFGQAGKNKIINGNFGVWQRGTTFNAIPNNSFVADRWSWFYDGTATWNCTQQTFTPGSAPVAGYEGSFFMRAALSANTSGTYGNFIQKIEDVRTFAGQPVTISFWAKADSARSSLVYFIQNFGSGGSSTVVVTTPSITYSTSWARYTFTLSAPSIAGKTIGTGSYLEIGIRTTATSGSTLDIWGVQVEYGLKATPFQTASGGSIQNELAMCQRYYWRVTGGDIYASYGLAYPTSTSDALAWVQFPVIMRTKPSGIDWTGLALHTPGISSFAFTTLVIGNANTFGVQLAGGVAGTPLVAYRPYFVSMNGSASHYLGFSAEL
jgi:hypothetical protein